jgi:hypothetical protein
MGRPLKIQKYSTNSGTGSPGAAVGIDIGFPNFGSLTDPVYNTNPETLSSSDYLGVVGGLRTTATSATNPVVKCIVNIANSYTGTDNGVILRQKGAHKFLVATNTAIDPANAVVGVSVRIASLGDTNWVAMGAPVGAAVGTIFLVTAAAAASTTGTCQEVGVCVLDNDATPAGGNMAIGFSVGDSTITYISKLTNKWLLDWTGGNDYGYASVVNDVRYASNFFTDEGTVIKSGTANTTVVPGQVEKWTS